jgi:phage gp29-like protein
VPTPDLRHHRDLPIASYATFADVATVRSALRDLENGQFTRAAQLVDAMGRDDRIAGVMATRVDALLGQPMQFMVGNGARATDAATMAAGSAEDSFPQSDLGSLLRWGLFLNAGVGEILWDRQADRWKIAGIKVWHPQYLRWQDDDTGGGHYRILTRDGEVPVTPGTGNWILYTPHGRQRGWMSGLVRQLALPWLMRQWAYRDWARYSEVHGMPIRVGVVPPEADPKEKDEFIRALDNLGNEATVKVAQGIEGQKFDLKLLEAVANGHEGFQRLIEKTEESISISILGQNMTTSIKGGGSYAAAEVHERVGAGRTRADDRTLGHALYQQALRPWALYNFDDESAAPRPHWIAEEADASVDPTTALNGAQVTALLAILTAVATGQLPRDSGVAAIEASFPLTAAQAEQVMGSVGKGFAPTAPAAPPAPVREEVTENDG